MLGKYAEMQTGKPTKTVVIPDVNHNTELKNAQSENIFLTGDNLDVLKHLQRAYTNSIDVIYIDIKTTQSIQLQTARKGDNTGVLELVA